MSDIAIKVENLSKKYTIGGGGKSTIRESIGGLFTRSTKEDFWALRDINFEIKKGETVGVIGRNGAGKSTLLKILSRITFPTKGRVEINGRLSSLLEVGTGFHPELTGRENIFLNGSLLGMTREEIRSKFDEIVDFSGIEKFIDTPVKHYSSGMYVRLAFSVAAHLNTEVLLIDEVLAVGDAGFQKKCIGKMGEVAQDGKTVLIVSHDSNIIKTLTKRAILLSNSKIKRIADSNEIYESYYTNDEIGNFTKFENSPVKTIGVVFDKEVKIEVDLNIDESVLIPHFCFMIKNSAGDVICANNPKFQKLDIPLNARKSKMRISLASPLFRYGKYFLSIWIANGQKNIFDTQDCVSFEVSTIGKCDKHLGFIIPEYQVDFYNL